MKINRFNYEEFFILYIDHELNAEERADVERFVSEHPDLAAELDMLKDAVIKPERNIIFSGKENLLRGTDSQPVLNKDNYQDFFILYADDELTPQAKTEVEAFVYRHPELQSELEAFEQAKLIPEKIIFPFKEKLFRREKTPVIALWMRFTVAAMLLLTAGYVWIINRPAKNEIPVVAGLNEKKPQQSSAPVHELSSPEAANQEPVTINESVVEKKHMTKQNTHPPATYTAKSVEKTVITENNDGNKRLRPVHQPLVEKTEPDMSLVNVPSPEHVYNRTIANAQPQAQTMTVMDASYTEPQRTEENASSDYVAGISVDNPAIKPLFRKASRIINRVSALKSGETRVIISKKVEIAIQ